MRPVENRNTTDHSIAADSYLGWLDDKYLQKPEDTIMGTFEDHDDERFDSLESQREIIRTSLMAQPLAVVPTMNAAEPDARSHP